jgi:N-methylhydantoinase B/oxoprolinase/acetone carboxylase alpha subunit
MKFKSKYNVGDVVLFYNSKIHDNDIGTIGVVKISFSLETLQRESYQICPVRIDCYYSDNSVEVTRNKIRKKLNKKAFNKAFAEKCVKHFLTHQHEDKYRS